MKTEACCARSGTGAGRLGAEISEGGQQEQDHWLERGQNEK